MTESELPQSAVPDERELTMALQEGQVIDKGESPRSMRGEDQQLHDLWDAWQKHGAQTVRDRFTHHAPPGVHELARWRVLNGDARHPNDVQKEVVFLDSLRKRAYDFGRFVQKLGSEDAALNERRATLLRSETRAEAEARARPNEEVESFRSLLKTLQNPTLVPPRVSPHPSPPATPAPATNRTPAAGYLPSGGPPLSPQKDSAARPAGPADTDKGTQPKKRR